jgi:hypothetical protein
VSCSARTPANHKLAATDDVQYSFHAEQPTAAHMYLLACCATHCSVPLLEEMPSKLAIALSTLGSAEPARLLIML